MDEAKVEFFNQKIKQEIHAHKFLDANIIYLMIRLFPCEYQKADYPKTISNPLQLALQFYQYYNKKYYQIILQGIKEKRILIGKNIVKPYVDCNGQAYIKLFGDDRDVFILVHEFAHYIDRKCNIIPDSYYFLAEVYSFYLEKKLEKWLLQEQYQNLIIARRNNRMYYEAKMIKAIQLELHYEKLYQQKGFISKCDIKEEDMNYILAYDIEHIHDLVMYPLANILSDYILENNLLKSDDHLGKVCLDTNLYDVLDDYLSKAFKK